MAMTFYYGSGSPYAWKVHLALEHKALPYERKVLSFAAGDTRKPEFVALNPRHRVPTIVDGDFVLYESNAIVEYLEDAYPGRGAPLFPAAARERALVRRMIAEIDDYTDKAFEPVLEQAFWTKSEDRDAAKIAAGRQAVTDELAMLTRSLRGPFLAGPLSAADYALYPQVAFLFRAQAKKLPDLDAAALLTPELAAWKARVEALPYFESTIPPHWREG
jgi:glutathione S-transferase